MVVAEIALRGFNQGDLKKFYFLMESLKNNIGGFHYLKDCHGRMEWPERGVYYFFEPGEFRLESNQLRVVRVGTHAVSRGSKTTLWQRLRTHRGHMSGRGNHRASVFRLLVGSALIKLRNYPPSAVMMWGKGNTAPRGVRTKEEIIEIDVTEYIGSMPFLWIAVDDGSGPESQRKYIEKNSIALLSNINGCPDIPSSSWIGKLCRSANVRASGLWNSDHVSDDYEPEFLEILEDKVEEMGR
jgi:hypothetical protein